MRSIASDIGSGGLEIMSQAGKTRDTLVRYGLALLEAHGASPWDRQSLPPATSGCCLRHRSPAAISDYRKAWRLYYMPRHLVRVIGRGLYYGLDMQNLRSSDVRTWTAVALERLHPLFSGALRIRDRRSRRPGLPRPAWLPHALNGAGRNAAILLVTFTLLFLAWLVELALRARGGLERYALDEAPRDTSKPQGTFPQPSRGGRDAVSGSPSVVVSQVLWISLCGPNQLIRFQCRGTGFWQARWLGWWHPARA